MKNWRRVAWMSWFLLGLPAAGQDARIVELEQNLSVAKAQLLQLQKTIDKITEALTALKGGPPPAPEPRARATPPAATGS